MHRTTPTKRRDVSTTSQSSRTRQKSEEIIPTLIHNQPMKIGDDESFIEDIVGLGREAVHGILDKNHIIGSSFKHECGPNCARKLLINPYSCNPYLVPMHVGFIRAASLIEEVTRDVELNLEDYQVSESQPSKSQASSSDVVMAKKKDSVVAVYPTPTGGKSDSPPLIRALKQLDNHHNAKYIVRGETTKRSVQVIYITPCGKVMLYLEHIRKWLLKTGIDLDIDYFTFNPTFMSQSFYVTPNWYWPDITNGRENIPISAINCVDNQPYDLNKFQYTAKRLFNPNVNINPNELENFCSGCSCEDNCWERYECECQKTTYIANCFKSYGYNYKRLNFQLLMGIYECNKYCKCNSHCINRVVQNGIRVKLQLFKTPNKGWGIRTLHWIPKGAFICAYYGEMITQKLLQEDDKYEIDDIFLADMDFMECAQDQILLDHNGLFSFDNSREKLFIGKASETKIFCIDATRYTNVGRLFNHSCSPNIMLQNVFIETHDLRLSHIAYFALTDINPLEELTWDYQYALDSDGSRVLYCKCDSGVCRHRIL
ncbi:hypothetical protein RDWZM_004801 [Blomia tropicalis]|uniref:Histone-lysine N-methyltransferase eggless n=1 Tax=Blomia tropicalis TaxID=40697 RepID=A0A9Q0M4X4_BLOTA|nr:hypothetical protein RDWZM_004801 [Blomia tropicalis]